ncbi:MAG: DUF2934 domain-containing protein [Candidatus Omnitrophota bacterium]
MAFTKLKSKIKLDTSSCCSGDLTDKIRKRAYELFEKRGRKPGHAMEDWLQAEREVRRSCR